MMFTHSKFLQAIQTLIISKQMAIKVNLSGLFKLLKQDDASGYYDVLGDDVLEFNNENFRNKNKSLWLNLGYWKEAKTYSAAATALADLLATSIDLRSSDKLLDVGNGFGEQDRFWAQKYNVESITALNITPHQIKIAKMLINKNGLAKRVHIQYGSATHIPYPDNTFDKVIALEATHHFNTREKFFSEAFRVLKPGGVLGTAEILPEVGYKPFFLLKISQRLLRKIHYIPEINIYDKNVYVSKLVSLGFVDITLNSIKNFVFPGIMKFTKLLYQAKKNKTPVDREKIVVQLTEEEINECVGTFPFVFGIGINDYVIFTAKKPI